MKEKNAKRVKLITAILKFLLLLVVVIGIPAFVVLVHPEILKNFESIESINALLEDYKTASIAIYIVLQIVQIVISIIPGQALQVAAGYAYSNIIGYIVTIAGIALGSIIAFYLAKILGRDLIHILFGEQKIKEFVEMLNSKKAFTLIFLIFLIPGIPKDVVTYAAGISDMDVRPFLIISLIGRTPGIVVSLIIGDLLRSGSYTSMIVLIVLSILLFILGVVKRKSLLYKMNQWYDQYIDHYVK